MSWKEYTIGDILKRRKDFVDIIHDKNYKLVTVRLYHNGVILRKNVKGFEIGSKMSQVKAGDFILSGIDARNGAFGIVPQELNGALVTNDFWCLEPDEKIIDKHFLLFLTATNYFDQICKQSSDGTTQRIRLQKEKFFKHIILLPPINEQEKILLKLKQNTEIAQNLSNELTYQLTLVKQLRQAFLSEAMQGKLVESEKLKVHKGAEETGQQLLERIRKEKQELIKNGKLKKEKPLPPIKPEEIPFEIPEDWEWCRLGKIIQYTESLDVQKHLSPNTLINYVDIDTIDNQNHVIREPKVKKVAELSTRARRVLREGYIAYSTVRPYLKNIAIIEDSLENYIGSTGLNVFKSIGCELKFVFYFLLTPYVNNSFKKLMVGFNSPSITNEQFENCITPIPPLSTQQRIVAKLDQLMSLCDGLESGIKASKEQNDLLLQEVLREAMEGKDIAEPINIGKTVSFKPTNVDYYRRSVLAAEIVWQLHKEPTLGHLKLQKLIYLCQKTSEMQLPTNFLRQAMGPYDNRLMRSIDKQLIDHKWFVYCKDDILKYQPLEKAGQHHADYLKYFNGEDDGIQNLINKFKTTKSDVIEIVATLFACIEAILDEKAIFSEALLIKRFYEWSEEKGKFSESEVKNVFERMKKNGIVPVGFK